MYAFIERYNWDISKVSWLATLFGFLLMIVGAIFAFSPVLFGSILPESLINHLAYYQWLPVTIMTVGVLLNILSYRLNTPVKK